MDYQSVLREIESYPVITIYRHSHPDCDAVGSQFGLKNWIQENWPEKQVYALGDETCTQGSWPKSDKLSDENVKQSLAIVLDTAGKDRIDDQRFATAAEIIKIDHHPNHEPYGNLMLVDDHSAAVCEILSEFFKQNPDKILSKKTCEYLYQGLLTDTLCFRTSNTTSHTLEMAAFLAGQGIAIPELNRRLFDQSYARFRFGTWIRSHVQVKENQLAYEIITLKNQNEWKLSGSEARNFIDELGHVREFEAWALFTEKEEDGKILYDGSLRSKNVVINDIAEEYHGGGHKNACGVKNLGEEDVKSLLSSLLKRIHEKDANA